MKPTEEELEEFTKLLNDISHMTKETKRLNELWKKWTKK